MTTPNWLKKTAFHRRHKHKYKWCINCLLPLMILLKQVTATTRNRSFFFLSSVGSQHMLSSHSVVKTNSLSLVSERRAHKMELEKIARFSLLIMVLQLNLCYGSGYLRQTRQEKRNNETGRSSIIYHFTVVFMIFLIQRRSHFRQNCDRVGYHSLL